VSNRLSRRVSQIRSIDEIAVREEDVNPTTRVRCDRVSCLPLSKEHRYGDDFLGLNGEVERIRNDQSSIRYREIRTSTERHSLKCLCLNGGYSRSVIQGFGDCYGSDRKVRDSKVVRNTNANLLSAYGHLHRLTNGGIEKHSTSLVLENLR
jgi:hypothetical protein